MTRRTTRPALNELTEAVLRPLDRLAAYLNGDDPRVSAHVARDRDREIWFKDPRRYRTTVDPATAAALVARLRAASPEGSPERARRFFHLGADMLWIETLTDFASNPYRDRLRRCENPACRRWYVDHTKNDSRLQCSRPCTIKVSSAKRTTKSGRRRTTRRGDR